MAVLRSGADAGPRLDQIRPAGYGRPSLGRIAGWSHSFSFRKESAFVEPVQGVAELVADPRTQALGIPPTVPELASGLSGLPIFLDSIRPNPHRAARGADDARIFPPEVGRKRG